MWRGLRQTGLQAIVLSPKWRRCIPHLRRFLWLRLRQMRWGVGYQKAPRHPRILPVVGRVLDRSLEWRPVDFGQKNGAKGRRPKRESKCDNNCAKYVTGVAPLHDRGQSGFRGVGVWVCCFIGGLRIQCPPGARRYSYFLIEQSFNVRGAEVMGRPPVGRLLRWIRRSRSAQGSTECHLFPCVP